MSDQKIEIVVNKEGKLEVEFTGFPGELCYAEAERLEKILKKFGVSVKATELIAKSPEQIACELGLAEKEEGIRPERD